jgi:UDP-N-acetylglucosamine acyltransferase
MRPSLSSVDRLAFRFPGPMLDAITEVDADRVVAVKNVTVNEDHFQGHFPGMPLMPGVLMIESLAQAAAVLIAKQADESGCRPFLRGVTNAKFRRQVVPGDRVRVEVVVKRARARLVQFRGVAFVGEQVVAEADVWLGLTQPSARVHPSAVVHEGAIIGAGTEVGPGAVIGAHVTIGVGCHVGASTVIDGWTTIGDGTQVFPFASIGLVPQDLKFAGEMSRLVVGKRNIFREFVTVHRGTQGGGGETRIGDDNLFQAYSHVAHDCVVGNKTIFGNGATLGGHVVVEDYVIVSALSGVHQFCRVGRYAFIGGASVVTKDALPFGRTVGNRARFYGLNTIGLVRRGFSQDTVRRLKQAYRYLMQSKLNASQALTQIEADPLVKCPEVEYLVAFIRSAKRGVTLKRATRRSDEPLGDD